MRCPLVVPIAFTSPEATGISSFSDGGLPVSTPMAGAPFRSEVNGSTTYWPELVVRMFVGTVATPLLAGSVVFCTLFDCRFVLSGTVLSVLVHCPVGVPLLSVSSVTFTLYAVEPEGSSANVSGPAPTLACAIMLSPEKSISVTIPALLYCFAVAGHKDCGEVTPEVVPYGTRFGCEKATRNACGSEAGPDGVTGVTTGRYWFPHPAAASRASSAPAANHGRSGPVTLRTL